jgi:serine/threonine protein kinase
MVEKPQKIGKYEVKSLLGEGGIGAVYAGYDPDIQRRVAIKILHPHLTTGKVGEELLVRFKTSLWNTSTGFRCTSLLNTGLNMGVASA